MFTGIISAFGTTVNMPTGVLRLLVASAVRRGLLLCDRGDESVRCCVHRKVAAVLGELKECLGLPEKVQ